MHANRDVRSDDQLLLAVQHLLDNTRGFVTAWGFADEVILLELEAFFGASLPEPLRALLRRYGNLHIGYWSIAGLGPVEGGSAAQALTEERRGWWPSLPQDRLVLGEHNTDMTVLTRSGSIELRTESTEALHVIQEFASFSDYLRYVILLTVADAKWLGDVPESYSPFSDGGA